jgi:hypothetical protein
MCRYIDKTIDKLTITQARTQQDELDATKQYICSHNYFIHIVISVDQVRSIQA